MSIDLEDSLAQLARSVGDEVTTARMTGQVHHMVSRVRRRRAARQAAQGAVGIGAVAAVAFGAVQLAGRDATSPAPAATQDAVDPTPQPAECGGPAPATPAFTDETAATWRLTGDVSPAVPAGRPVEIATRLMDGQSRLVTQGEATAVSLTLTAVQDGLVVARTTITFSDERPGVTVNDYVISQESLDLVACDSPAALPPGDYDLVAQEVLLLADGRTPVEVIGGPWPFTITEVDAAADPEPEPGTLTEEQLQAQAAVDAILADAATWGVDSPGCGWLVADDPASPLTLTVRSDAATFPAGQLLELEADLTTIDGAHVIGNAGGWAARLVLARDGVVVGATYWDPEDATLVDVGPDSPVTLPLLGGLNVCSRQMTDTFGPALPPGTYQAHAVLDVMLKEVTTADGEATSRSDLVRAVSAPFDLTVTAP